MFINTIKLSQLLILSGLISIAFFPGVANSQNQAHGKLILSENKQTSYVISLANDAIPAEQNAAQQLQKYFQEITGASISIEKETELDNNRPQILIGAGQRVKALLPNQNWNDLKGDGIIIKTVGQHLILAGDRPRGTLYAVYQFLENSAGCRWFTAEVKSIPQKIRWELGPQDTVYVPPFSYREHYTIPPAMRENNFELAVTLRNNGHFYRLTPEWGGHYSILGFVHTFTPLLPLEKYFKDHPEWYSDPKRDGLPCTHESEMPGPEHTQLCVSNPEMRQEFIKNALHWCERNPQAGYISISENDFGPYCKCPDCDAFAKREGSHSGPILDFVNQVADAIGEKYPHFRVETLAYHGTLKPPKTIRPRKNVIIRMAPIDTDYGKAINSEHNADVRDNLKAWAKIAPQLFIWNYVTNFSSTMMPHPNMQNWANDLQFFAGNHVKGIYQEGDYSTFGVGDFVFMRAWLMGKLMWNPNLNQEELMDDFLQGYYGAAAPYLKDYLQLINDSFQNQGIELNTFNQQFQFLTVETLNDATRLFNRAEQAVAGNSELLHRVQREKVSLQYAWIYRYPILKLIAQGKDIPFTGPENYGQAVEKFIGDARSFKVQNYRLNQPFSKLEESLRKSVGTRQPNIPDFLKNVAPQHIFDLQENVFKLWSAGKGVTIIDDPEASNGKTAAVTGHGWDVEIYLGAYHSFLEPHQWRSFARVRLDRSHKDGTALSYGIYDHRNKKYVHSARLDSREIVDGKYQWLDLGRYPLTPGAAFHFQRYEGASKIYIDQVVMVREMP